MSLRLAVTCIVLFLWSMVACPTSADAGPKRASDRDRAEAAEWVDEALHREIYGGSERRQLLERALALDPDNERARWHLGFVRMKKDWVRIDDVASRCDALPQLAKYEEFRETQKDDLDGHVALAEWCRKNRLPIQERAHLLQIISLDPAHAGARTRLGYREVNGKWISEQEIAAEQQNQKQRELDLATWKRRIERLRSRLTQRRGDARNEAVQELLDIRDPAAIPAMETILAIQDAVCARAVVECLSQMKGEEATIALTRQAVLSQWPTVRDAAGLALRDRPYESFAPTLLAELFTPVTSASTWSPTAAGDLVFQNRFVREGQEERQMFVFGTAYWRRARAGGDRVDTMSRSFFDSLQTEAEQRQAVARQNAMTNEMNDRIARALSLATGETLPAEPQAWWQWWNDYNGIADQGQKPTRTIQRGEQVTMQDRVPMSFQLDGDLPAPQPRRRCECFVAGTPVATARGPRAIETVQVGDLVLSQDIATGELAYKPVVATSIRPPMSLIKVTIGQETFETTPGHLFWVAGQGWTKAEELSSGMLIHSIDGGLPLVSVESGSRAPAFNLAVDEFRTYVVGDHRLLSHDVTARRATDAIVPGLRER